MNVCLMTNYSFDTYMFHDPCLDRSLLVKCIASSILVSLFDIFFMNFVTQYPWPLKFNW